MENRLEKLRLEIDRLIKEKQPEKDKYFFSHLYGVSHFCTLLALRRNLNVEIARSCGMLHDICPVLTGSYDNHAIKGAEQAESLLKSLKLYNEDEIAIITTAVLRHSDKNIVHEPYDELLKDADVMHHCLYDIAIPVKEKEIERYKSILIELGCTSMECKSYPFNLTYPDYMREIFPLAIQKKESLSNISVERFSIPGVGGLIIKDIGNIEHILLQTRCKSDAPDEDGLLEIPAGKIRAFENIFDTLKREIKEETGLDVVEILGEDRLSVYEGNNYKVINFMPFSCSQNIEGTYPIMVFVFICRVTGDLLPFSDESKDYRWTPISEINEILTNRPEVIYPMHIDTLKKYLLTDKDIEMESCDL